MAKLLSPRAFFAWIFSAPVVYFLAGFLGNYYDAFWILFPLVFFAHLAAGLFTYHLLGRAENLYTQNPWQLFLSLTLFVFMAGFVTNMYRAAKTFPVLFDSRYMLLEYGQQSAFWAGVMLAFPVLMYVIPLFKTESFRKSGFYHSIHLLAPGILLAGLFFAFYFIFSFIFNQPAFDVDDIFFDTDGLLWRRRFATPDFQDYYWRSVHPFVLILVRPLVFITALFLKGDSLSAAFLLTAVIGAACVFLVWYFVKRVIGNSLYALLIAGLFGASAGQLIFGFLLETYILLAFVMLLFLILLLDERPFFMLVLTGAASFGITLTNFIHTAIAFMLIKRGVNSWVKYGLAVGVLVIPLTLLNNFVYPKSQPYFFDPSSFGAEADNTFYPTVSRGLAIVRVMTLHSVVAPDPLILEEEIPFLKVWIFKADPMRLSEYETVFSTGLAFFWAGLILLGGILFLRTLKKQDWRFPIAFLLILAFNFVLHLQYGKDLFLYAANWLYAFILFLAFGWRDLSDKKWFQGVLLVFIALLLVNNARLIMTMLETSAMHLK